MKRVKQFSASYEFSRHTPRNDRVVSTLRHFGGFASLNQIVLAAGMDSRDVADALRNSPVQRIEGGWLLIEETVVECPTCGKPGRPPFNQC